MMLVYFGIMAQKKGRKGLFVHLNVIDTEQTLRKEGCLYLKLVGPGIYDDNLCFSLMIVEYLSIRLLGFSLILVFISSS